MKILAPETRSSQRQQTGRRMPPGHWQYPPPGYLAKFKSRFCSSRQSIAASRPVYSTFVRYRQAPNRAPRRRFHRIGRIIVAIRSGTFVAQHFCGISPPRMDRIRELERLIGQRAELVEHLKGSPNDLDLRLRFIHLSQQVMEIEHSLSLAALLFARRC